MSKIPTAPNILRIDRSKPFDPTKFIGDGWTIEKENEQSLTLTEIDLSKIELETILKRGEGSISGERRLERLKGDGRILLDSKIFHALWKDKSKIPEDWKKRDANSNIRYITFDGTELRGPNDERGVLCLNWLDSEWNWHVALLDDEFDISDLSALLEK